MNPFDEQTTVSPKSDDGVTLSIRNVRAVLADRIIDDATVIVEDGLITSIDSDGVTNRDALDGAGLFLLPGLIDTHSDGLEKEIAPRRTVEFPLEFALGSFEGRARAAGVTTMFHGLAYQDRPRLGRSVERARDIDRAIRRRSLDPLAGVDHHVLYRFEARDEGALAPLLIDLTENEQTICPLVSFEDHTPGQGQFRDLAQFAAAIDPTDVPQGMSAHEYVEQLKAEADQLIALRSRNLARLSPLAYQNRLRLLAHDAETIDDVVVASEAGASVAEFPVSLIAAVEARNLGMSIVMGAPNALRGTSHSGNLSARRLVEAGLCDVLASDYLPSTLLAAAFTLAANGSCTLPQAVGLITRGPARLTGLGDRGRIDVGCRADLLLVDYRPSEGRQAWPTVVGVQRAFDDLRRRQLVA